MPQETVAIEEVAEQTVSGRTATIRYRFAGTSVLKPGQLNRSLRTFPSVSAARNAARAEGFHVLPGLSHSEHHLRRKLGLTASEVEAA